MDEHGNVPAVKNQREPQQSPDRSGESLRAGLPVDETTDKHGELRPDDRHHRGGHQVGGRENSINDGHAAQSTGEIL